MTNENYILGVDTGPRTSGYAVINVSRTDGFYDLIEFDCSIENEVLLAQMLGFTGVAKRCGHIVIEDIVAYGRVVGNDTLNSAKWVGRYDVGWRTTGRSPMIVSRNDVKIVLCGTRTVLNDGGQRVNVSEKMLNEAVRQKFEPCGGGADPYKGIKSQPGPLFGIKKHVHSALALATVGHELIQDVARKGIRG